MSLSYLDYLTDRFDLLIDGVKANDELRKLKRSEFNLPPINDPDFGKQQINLSELVTRLLMTLQEVNVQLRNIGFTLSFKDQPLEVRIKAKILDFADGGEISLDLNPN